MTHNSRQEEIRGYLSGINDHFLDCLSCPPERNCCVFSGRYTHSLDEEAAEAAFGKEAVEALLENGNILHDQERQRYIMREMRCPALSSEYLCRVHEKKAELELEPCMNFPAYYVDSFKMDGVAEPFSCVMVDYRCSSIERRWDEIEPILQMAEREFWTPVYVAFYSRDNMVRRERLGFFSRIRAASGLPSQKMI